MVSRVGQKAEIMNIGSGGFKVIVKNVSEETLLYIYDNEIKELIWNGSKWIVKCVMPIGSTYEQKAGTESLHIYLGEHGQMCQQITQGDFSG